MHDRSERVLRCPFRRSLTGQRRQEIPCVAMVPTSVAADVFHNMWMLLWNAIEERMVES